MKRLLFITYFWPPASKATVHWPVKIIKYLPEFDWSPSVLTVENESFESRDESLLQDVDKNLEILKTKTWEPFSFYKKFLGKDNDEKITAGEAMSSSDLGLRHRISKWIRWNIFIPDARICWYFYAINRGLKYLQENKIDRIVTIGPPHSTHLIGCSLSKKTGIPFIPILIDPWTDIVYYKSFKRSGFARDVDIMFEKKVLRQASKIVFVTNSTKEDYEKKYTFIKDKTKVLYWGYNEDDFRNIKRTREKDDELVILHSGNIFDYQNPSSFWKTLSKKINSGEKIRLKFTGTVSPLIKKEIRENGLNSITQFLGVIPYKEMLHEIMNADVLLVCPSEKRHLPGKLFEYLRSGNPILAFNDDNPEVKKLIDDANAGMMLNYSDNGEIFFRNLDKFQPNAESGKIFDRYNITTQFSELLNAID